MKGDVAVFLGGDVEMNNFRVIYGLFGVLGLVNLHELFQQKLMSQH